MPRERQTQPTGFRRTRRIAALLPAFGATLGFLLFLATAGSGPARAQGGEISDACQTLYGICRVPPRYVGTYCECYGDIGEIVRPPPPPRRPAAPAPWEARPDLPATNACETDYGICRVPFGPVDSYCECYGDPGMRVPPPPPRF